MTKGRFTIESDKINSTYSIHIRKDGEVIFEISNWDSLSEMHKTECEEIVDLLNEQDQQIKEYKMVVASMMNPVKQVCKYYKETIKIDSNREIMRPVGKCLKEQDIRHCDSCKYFIPNMLKL